MQPFKSILKASRALGRIYQHAYSPSKPTKEAQPSIPYKTLLKSPGCSFLKNDILFAQTTLDSGVKLDACISTSTTMSIMTRRAYLEHCSNRPLQVSPVDIFVTGMEGGLVPAREWFDADFNFHCPEGSMFTISGEVHVVEEDIGEHGLCISIGIDLLKPAGASIILDIDKKGTDILWMSGSWALLRSSRKLII